MIVLLGMGLDGEMGKRNTSSHTFTHTVSTISLLMVSAPVPGQAKTIYLKFFLYRLFSHDSFGQRSSYFPKVCLPGMA